MLTNRPLIKTAALLATTTLFSVGCATTSVVSQYQPTSYTAAADEILKTDIKTLWSKDFDHHQIGLLKQVSDKIVTLARSGSVGDADLDKLAYYLRIYSSFGRDDKWLEGSAEALDHALLQLSQMPGFFDINKQSARLHEHYAVALYRLYFLKPMHKKVSGHVSNLSRLLKSYASDDLIADKSVDYAMWEVLRAAALLPYEARRKNQAEFIDAVSGQGELKRALLDFINAKNAVRANQDWPRQHALWALAQHYNLHAKQYWNAYYELDEEQRKKLDDDKMTLPVEGLMSQLDNQIWSAISTLSLAKEQTKQLFSVPYVVNSFRGKSECEEGTLKDRCIAPTIEQALPIKHVCSDSLTILAQDLSDAELAQSCQRLTSQEATFHDKLVTENQPVANDFNQSLRVVIFDDHAQYNMFGQLVFDIHTDNGGMYIEGTPQNPDNIATFYSYEQFWARPEFKVWNLNHEYVHYLDGRFVKYDTYGHFPSHMVWWSEGLAEYIAFGDENPKIGKLLGKLDEFLTLKQVFDTEYKDGTDQVYKWGYLGVRFMYENQRETYHKLAHYLETDYFDGYKKLLDASGEQFAKEFSLWLGELKANVAVVEQAKDPRQPRQFYRYSYKPYLQPAHLTEDLWHMHWQYWHENALKAAKASKVAGQE